MEAVQYDKLVILMGVCDGVQSDDIGHDGVVHLQTTGLPAVMGRHVLDPFPCKKKSMPSLLLWRWFTRGSQQSMSPRL